MLCCFLCPADREQVHHCPRSLLMFSRLKAEKGACHDCCASSLVCSGLFRVQPLSVVDNSDISPIRLTFPLEAPYSTFSEGNGPCSSFQAKRILHEPACVLARVLPHLLSRAALCPLLALSRPCPGESSCQDTHHAPTSPPAPLPRRLPCLSSRLHSLVGCRANACATLE